MYALIRPQAILPETYTFWSFISIIKVYLIEGSPKGSTEKKQK